MVVAFGAWSVCVMLAGAVGAVGAAGLTGPGPDSPLTYTDRSAQFATPAWENGRSVLKFADVNLDGHPDLVSVGDHSSPLIGGPLHGIMVWLGDGAGNFAPPIMTGDFGYGGVDVGDVNNDGKPDIAYGVHHNYASGDFGDQVLEVALGDGTGANWTPWDDGLGEQGQTYGMFGCALADFNVDGWLDLASNAFGCCDGVHAYLNNKNGSWSAVLGLLNSNSTMDAAIGDVNNDGYPDFLTANQLGTVWANNGAAAFQLWEAGLSGGGNLGRFFPSAGDVDRDGREDLAFCTAFGPPQVWRSTPAGWVKISAGLPASGSYWPTHLCDMNGDGWLDLVTYRDTMIEIYLGNGGASWTLDATIQTPSPGTFRALALADVDHNGRPDIALISAKPFGSFGSQNVLQMWTENTPATAPSIRITGPTEHRTLRVGMTTFVQWLGAMPGGGGLVSFDVSKDGANGPWTSVGSFMANSGRWQTTIDAKWAAGPSGEVYLRAMIEKGPIGASDLVGPITVIGDGPSCYADCDASGVLEIDDFICFQTTYAVGSPGADCDQRGGLDIDDFICFQTQYAIGC